MKSIQVSDELHERIMSLKEPYQDHIQKTLAGITIKIPDVIAAGLHLLEKELTKNAHDKNN